MSVNRKRRRADGTLRPTIIRQRAKKRAAKNAARDASPERQEWLANFNPGDRERFFNHVVLKQAIFLGAFEKQTGLQRVDAANLLGKVAEERRWRKLRTKDGLVVGIAPPRVTRGQPAAGETGRTRHDWFFPHENGYPNLGPWESCRNCGVVKNAQNADSETCRGIVKVEPRKERAAAGEAGRSEPEPLIGSGVDGAAPGSTMPASPTAVIHSPSRYERTDADGENRNRADGAERIPPIENP